MNLEKAPKRKTSDFHPLRSFCARKKCCLCCFVSWFLLVSVFSTLKIFSYKKIETVLITSYTILLKYTPINHPIENLAENFWNTNTKALIHHKLCGSVAETIKHEASFILASPWKGFESRNKLFTLKVSKS